MKSDREDAALEEAIACLIVRYTDESCQPHDTLGGDGQNYRWYEEIPLAQEIIKLIRAQDRNEEWTIP